MGLEKTFQSLPTWAKGVVAVAVLGITTTVGYMIYVKVKKMSATRKERKTSRDNDKDMEEAKRKGQKPSFTKAQAEQMADQLKTSFDGYTTDNKTVYRVFDRMTNDLDVLALIQAFGIRKISSGKFNLTPDEEGTLNQIIANEMSDSEVKKINDSLSKKGIKYQF